MENNIEILLVEDTPSDVRLTQEALKRSGLKYTMSVVNDGVEAMDYLNERKTGGQQMPDLILLDLNMPRKNGYECLSEIKVDDKLKNLPVIIFSTSFDPEMINELYKNGAQYYISKPNEFTKLKQVIHQAISSSANSLSKTSLENFVLQP